MPQLGLTSVGVKGGWYSAQTTLGSGRGREQGMVMGARAGTDLQSVTQVVDRDLAPEFPCHFLSGTRNMTSHVFTYPQVKYHLSFAVADKLMGILRVKNDIILKFKGENTLAPS